MISGFLISPGFHRISSGFPGFPDFFEESGILNSFELLMRESNPGMKMEWRIRDTSGHHSTAPGLRLIPYVRRTPLKRNYGSNSLPPALLENRGRQWHCMSFVFFSPNNLHKRTHFYPISVPRLPFFGLDFCQPPLLSFSDFRIV